MIEVGLLARNTKKTDSFNWKINVAIFILAPSFNYIWLSNILKLILRFCYLNYIDVANTHPRQFLVFFLLVDYINENENEDVKYVLSLEH